MPYYMQRREINGALIDFADKLLRRDEAYLSHWANLIRGLLGGKYAIAWWPLHEMGNLGELLAEDLKVRNRDFNSERFPVLLDKGTRGIVGLYDPVCLFIPSMRTPDNRPGNFDTQATPLSLGDDECNVNSLLGAWSCLFPQEPGGPPWRRLLHWLAQQNPHLVPGSRTEAERQIREIGREIVLDQPVQGEPTQQNFCIPVLSHGVILICESCQFELHQYNYTLKMTLDDLERENTAFIHCPACGSQVVDARTGLLGGAFEPNYNAFYYYQFNFSGAASNAFNFRLHQDAAIEYGEFKIQVERGVPIQTRTLFYPTIPVLNKGGEEMENMSFPDIPLRASYMGLLKECRMTRNGNRVCYTVSLHGMGTGNIQMEYDTSRGSGDTKLYINPRVGILLWPNFRHPNWKRYLAFGHIASDNDWTPRVFKNDGAFNRIVREIQRPTREIDLPKRGFAFDESPDFIGMEYPEDIPSAHLRPEQRDPQPCGGLWRCILQEETTSGNMTVELGFDFGTSASVLAQNTGTPGNPALAIVLLDNLAIDLARPLRMALANNYNYSLARSEQLMQDSWVTITADGTNLLASMLEFRLGSGQKAESLTADMVRNMRPFLDMSIPISTPSRTLGNDQVVYQFKWANRLLPAPLRRPGGFEHETDVLISCYTEMFFALALANILKRIPNTNTLHLQYTAPMPMMQMRSSIDQLQRGVRSGVQNAVRHFTRFTESRVVVTFNSDSESFIGLHGMQRLQGFPRATPKFAVTADWGGGTIDIAFKAGNNNEVYIFDSINIGGSDILRSMALNRDGLKHMDLVMSLDKTGHPPDAWLGGAGSGEGSFSIRQKLFLHGYLNGILLVLGLVTAGGIREYKKVNPQDNAVPEVTLACLGRGWRLINNLFPTVRPDNLESWIKEGYQWALSRFDISESGEAKVEVKVRIVLAPETEAKKPVAYGLLGAAAGNVFSDDISNFPKAPMGVDIEQDTTVPLDKLLLSNKRMPDIITTNPNGVTVKKDTMLYWLQKFNGLQKKLVATGLIQEKELLFHDSDTRLQGLLHPGLAFRDSFFRRHVEVLPLIHGHVDEGAPNDRDISDFAACPWMDQKDEYYI